MRMSWLTVASAVLIPAASTLAASFIATPSLRAPTGGSVRCQVSNVSSTRTIQFVQTIHEFDGSAGFGPDSVTLKPNENASAEGFVTQGQCTVVVTSGSKQDVRVALEVLDATGKTLAAVNGQ